MDSLHAKITRLKFERGIWFLWLLLVMTVFSYTCYIFFKNRKTKKEELLMSQIMKPEAQPGPYMNISENCVDKVVYDGEEGSTLLTNN